MRVAAHAEKPSPALQVSSSHRVVGDVDGVMGAPLDSDTKPRKRPMHDLIKSRRSELPVGGSHLQMPNMALKSKHGGDEDGGDKAGGTKVRRLVEDEDAHKQAGSLEEEEAHKQTESLVEDKGMDEEGAWLDDEREGGRQE